MLETGGEYEHGGAQRSSGQLLVGGCIALPHVFACLTIIFTVMLPVIAKLASFRDCLPQYPTITSSHAVCGVLEGTFQREKEQGLFPSLHSGGGEKHF